MNMNGAPHELSEHEETKYATEHPCLTLYRHFKLLLSLFLGICFPLCLFAAAMQSEEEKIRTEFEKDAAHHIASVRQILF